MKRQLLPILFASLATGLHGQSADSFVVEAPTPSPTPTEAERADPGLIAEPSRYAGLNIDAYVQALVATFAMSNREVDPFGYHQDPDWKPPTPVRSPSRFKPKIVKTPQLTLEQIVNGIPITAVVPSKRMFLVGERGFRVGDRIPLNTGRGKLINVQVVALTTDSVTFRNTQTGDTARVILGISVPGMSRGGQAAPPGLVPRDSTAPLEITPVGIGGPTTSR